MKKKTNEKKATKTKKKAASKTKKGKVNDSDEDESMNIENGTETTINDDNEQNDTQHSPRTKTLSATSNADESPTKSRLRSTCKLFF